MAFRYTTRVGGSSRIITVHNKYRNFMVQCVCHRGHYLYKGGFFTTQSLWMVIFIDNFSNADRKKSEI